MGDLWEILVPRAFNDGTAVPVEHHHAWDDKVQSIAGGLTILKTAKGVWQSPQGRVFREEMIPVRIACSETQMREIIYLTIRHYDQEAVMAYCISEQVIIVHAEDIVAR